MWKDLSMQEKAALMKIAVDGGVYSIDDIANTYNKYKGGGYIPSDSIKKRISDWEGSSMKTNRSFDAEARDFTASLPQGALSRLTQQQLDGLYSYSYNVGAGNFRKRVNPVLARYLEGQATIEDVQKSMWASKDSKLRGLAKRRNAERAMLVVNTPTTPTPIALTPVINTTPVVINQPLPLEKVETPQLNPSEVITTPSPVGLGLPITYNNSIEDTYSNKTINSFANVLSIMDMLNSPRKKVNIHI